MKKVKSDNENASLWCVLGETKAAQALGEPSSALQGKHHISVKMRGPLYKFDSSSLKDCLVCLDIMKTESKVSIFIYFQMI